MRLVDTLNYTIIIIYITLILNSFLSIFKIKMSLEKRIIKIAINVFMLLSIWSIYRLVNKIPDVNIYDYLIVILNSGLFIVSIYNSRNIQ